jgi:predicted amidohydrolase
MRIAFVQINCRFLERERNLRRALQLIASEKADLYVLPELFSSGYLFTAREEVHSMAESVPDGPTCQALLEASKRHHCHIVAGLPELAGGQFFNSSILVGPQGYLATYRKIHLFDEEKLWFTPGDRPFAVHDIGSANIGMMICFDWIFPESMRSLALAGADIVCHSANLVLPWCQRAMTTRCLENGVFAVTANRVGTDRRGDKSLHFTGASQITGPRGEILAQAGKAVEEIRVVNVDPLKAREKWLNSRNHLLQDRRPGLYLYNDCTD